MKRRTALIVMVLLLMATALVRAQEIVPVPGAEVDEDANITFPPPVYVLRGEVELRGTANVENMTNFFVEFRPLEFDTEENEVGIVATVDPDAQDVEDIDEEELDAWFPVTLPDNEPVVDDVLGNWNTETTPDGLYELRLTINVQGERPTFVVVSPIRIENEPPEFVDIEEDIDLEGTTSPIERPTLPPTPTAMDTTPTATANTNANVRTGDSVQFDVVEILFAGSSARIVGVSNRASGWYLIELEDGTRGWIAPSVVTVSGDVDGLPRINPPPTPTPAATATPIATATPETSANLAADSPSLTPAQPVCAQPFQVLVNITNNGSTATASEATVVVQDTRTSTGEVQASVSRVLPILQPGENFVIGADFTISTFFGEQHNIVVTIDTGNSVPETNETDNQVITTYTLLQGEDCP